MKTIAFRPLRLRPVVVALLGFAVGVAVRPSVRAQDAVVLTVLHSFGPTSGNGGDGSQPRSALVPGADGNLYGTTYFGGENGYGTVFKITAAGAYSVLYSFDGSNGANPDSTLVLGSDGNLYGTTAASASSVTPGPNMSTLFEITPAGQFTFLHKFDEPNGGGSVNGIILGGDGAFYGTTIGGGTSYDGTIFRVTPQGAFSVLYNFSGADGALPYGPLVLGSDGNFYGTTSEGGANTMGTVFQLSSTTGKLTILHSFDGTDGQLPIAGLVEGNAGYFYGTASSGGTVPDNSSNGGPGTVFQITSAGDFTVLHDFDGTNGVFPYYALAKGGGNFYGTAYHAIFEIDPFGEFTLLYDSGSNTGGMMAGLVQGADGALYGTTMSTDGDGGNVFKLTIAPVPSSFFAGQVILPNGVYYLNYDTTHIYGYDFGYYSYLEDRHYIYSDVLGYEYVFDAADGQDGVYLYDFKSQDFFYTSPSFPYPYLYDFGLKSVVFHFPQPEIPGPGYNPADNRLFYVFSTGQIIQK